MNRKLKLIFPLLLAAGFCLPALAQDEAAAPKEDPAAGAPAEAPAKPVQKKPAPKKKAKKKKKKAPPVSEYKFDSVDKTETYKFDKRANPIVKAKKKKKAAKKAPGTKGDSLEEKSLPSAKLKPAKAIGEAEQKAAEQAGNE